MEIKCTLHEVDIDVITVKKILSWPIQLKFIYSEKATNVFEIFRLHLTTVHTAKSKGKIFQNFEL